MVQVVVGEGDGETEQNGKDHHKHQQNKARGDHQVREAVAQQHLVLLTHAVQGDPLIAFFAVQPRIPQREKIDQHAKGDDQHTDNPLR